MQRIGNYRVETELGRDATGVVYEARHLVLPRRAIVKVMEELHPPRPLAVQLLREACILEALEHPGIVRVYESGLLPDRRPWFARERIDGATVADLLASGPLDPATAVVLLRDLAEVLEHAHRRGVVHCGLRPDRIVITGRSRGYPLCILDWSDARVHDTTASLPELAIFDYAAPELLGGGAIASPGSAGARSSAGGGAEWSASPGSAGARSSAGGGAEWSASPGSAGARSSAGGGAEWIDDRVDVFSLGVIAYQALTGELPFEAITATGEVQHVPTEVRCPDAPPELTGLVDSMLAWERFDRPSSAEATAELAHLAYDLAEPAPPPRLSGSMRIRQPRWTPSLPLPLDPDGRSESGPLHLGAELDLSAFDAIEDDNSEKSS